RVLSLEAAFARASRAIGAEAAPVVLPFADAAVDVDTPADLALVERVIGERGRAGARVDAAAPPSRAPR
ncbi:MAG: hypothetical protein KC560_08525, partial [Myxococcales bacterium]|nr:hypothetical protein [Myxococcales bacterium]